MAISAVAAGFTYGGSSLSFTEFPPNNIKMEDDTTLVSSLSGGYIATFWWSPDDSAGSYVALGATYFTDAHPVLSFFGPGYFEFVSNPILPYTTDGEKGYAGIVIFKLDGWAGKVVDTDEPGSGFRVDSLTDTTVSDWWEAAKLTSPEIYEQFGMEFTTGTLGSTPNNVIVDVFGWSGTVNLYSNPYLIPEPSTWLLLGAGSAFVVVMRRRKKQ